MTLIRLIVDDKEVLSTFSPIEIVNEIAQLCKGKGELPIDVYFTEVK